MDLNHTSKIQTLVRGSSILNQAEKQEWLELMELMNDRQLLELERILDEVSLKPQIQTAPKPAVTPKPEAPKLPPIVPKPKSNVDNSDLPKSPFSHILNLPGSQATVSPNISLKQSEPPKKPDSPFFKSLKNILAEKELPAAKIEKLPKPEEIKKAPIPLKVPPKPVPPPLKPLPKPLEHPKPKPELKKDSDKVRDSVLEALKRQKDQHENVTINVFVNDEKAKELVPEVVKQSQEHKTAGLTSLPNAETPQVSAQNSKIPAIVFASVGNPIDLNSQKQGEQELQKKEQEKKEPTVTLGKDLPKTVETLPKFEPKGELKPVIQATGAEIEKPLIQPKKDTGKFVIEEKPGDEVRIQTLEDLAGITPEEFQQHAVGTFLKKMQKLVAQYDLHTVFLSLENSPLYKAYIHTGVTWLKNGGNISSEPGLLLQKDFERFADLLIVMRART